MKEARYKTGRALEMAVKEAAKKSKQDVGKAIDDFYHGRLLERIFSEPSPSFILKGGRSMLARYVDVRRTRDSDLLFDGKNLQDAVDELKRLAAIDLGDHLEYRFVSDDPIVQDEDYRDGRRVTFTPVLGGAKELSNVAIDLVLDDVFTGEPEALAPANRLNIPSLPVYDYWLFPVVNSLCDKISAIMQKRENGQESSRVRDLSDLIFYILIEPIAADELLDNLLREMRVREIEQPTEFTIPKSWHGRYAQDYSNNARESRLPSELCVVGNVEGFVKHFIGPVLARDVQGKIWDPDTLLWK